MKRDVRLLVPVTKQEKEIYMTEAEKRGISFSSLARMALNEFIKKNK